MYKQFYYNNESCLHIKVEKQFFAGVTHNFYVRTCYKSLNFHFLFEPRHDKINRPKC
jgi:hypothetical protein